MVIKSGILNPQLWDKDDACMVDRGFTVTELFQPLGVEIIIPPFLGGREQLTKEEAIITQQIANERIHVERMIQRLKCWHIFDKAIPVNMFGSVNQIIIVCALLCNFQDPIISVKN